MINPQTTQSLGGWMQRVLLVSLFSLAFGYVESAVVVYLRAMYDPIRESLHPHLSSGSLLPLITVEQLRAADPLHVRHLGIEVGREVATMVMLAVVAALAMRRRGEWIALFMISFGMWDIAYYLGLKAMIDFPTSLLTWDILFLLPVPWLGPVLAPVIVSLSMIGAGLVVLAETDRRGPLRARWFHWTGIAAGAVIIVISFCKDYPQTTAGRLPEQFSWLTFATGEIIGFVAFGHAWLQGRQASGAYAESTEAGLSTSKDESNEVSDYRCRQREPIGGSE
jgi:hypothetical protein